MIFSLKAKIYFSRLVAPRKIHYICPIMKAKIILEQLAQFPHRGATTPEERQAAECLKKLLAENQIPAALETFKATSSYSWEVILISLTMIAGIVISPWLSRLATALALLGFWSYIRHFDGRSTVFTPFIHKKNSRNVVAQIAGSRESSRNIILMAHYDTARASAVFAPKVVKNFRQTFLFNTAIAIGTIIWAFLGEYWGSFGWFKVICGLMVLNHLTNVIIHIHREIAHRFVPGINDNGSGVAAIFEVLEKLKEYQLGSNLWIIFSGCEEAGIQGAKAFLKEHQSELPVANTFLINLDNIGKGRLHYVTGEGMLLYHNYDENLASICADLGKLPEYSTIRPLKYRRAYFDALAFAQNEYSCTTLIALDENGVIPNWHWYSDTLANIDFSSLERAVSFTTDLIKRIDAK
jgi:hypothetical protein